MTAVTGVLAEVAAGRLVVGTETVRGLELALDALLQLAAIARGRTA